MGGEKGDYANTEEGKRGKGKREIFYIMRGGGGF